MIGVFVGFSRIFLLGFLIFKGLTARRVSKSFGVKGLTQNLHEPQYYVACKGLCRLAIVNFIKLCSILQELRRLNAGPN
jgi:hypothetical protein